MWTVAWIGRAPQDKVARVRGAIRAWRRQNVVAIAGAPVRAARSRAGFRSGPDWGVLHPVRLPRRVEGCDEVGIRAGPASAGRSSLTGQG